MNKRKADKGIVLRMHLQNMAMGLAPVILFMPVALILHYMEQLGAWWVPLLFTYFAVYYTAQALILIPKHYTKLHHQLGSEMFYQLYPDEMKKALHRIRKTILPERELVIADYRSRMIDTDADERSRKRSTASAVLYTVAAAIVFVLAVFCLYRLIRGLQNGEKLCPCSALCFDLPDADGINRSVQKMVRNNSTGGHMCHALLRYLGQHCKQA